MKGTKWLVSFLTAALLAASFITPGTAAEPATKTRDGHLKKGWEG